MTNYQRIEMARETRLWIKDVIVPAVVAVGTLMYFNPGLKEKMSNKVVNIKDRFKK